ncbi:MAG: hypothetical protein BMS9Abin12_0391 [Acidimicrobiia bacterium]|nr:MAG: hypothetical protein BMS9Abin12_0391 [Acidimicrobiia bacterium]
MSDHAFLAVDLNTDERHMLAAALTAANPGRRLPGRKTPPVNWHITLRFLGECTDTQAERIMHQLSDTNDMEKGTVWGMGLDAFPRLAKAGVLFVTIEDEAGLLDRLAVWCDDAAVAVGFEPEDRPYVPHLTLTRARPAVDVSHTFQSWDDFRVRIGVRAVTLFRTRRNTDGIRYEPVDSLPLP